MDEQSQLTLRAPSVSPSLIWPPWHYFAKSKLSGNLLLLPSSWGQIFPSFLQWDAKFRTNIKQLQLLCYFNSDIFMWKTLVPCSGMHWIASELACGMTRQIWRVLTASSSLEIALKHLHGDWSRTRTPADAATAWCFPFLDTRVATDNLLPRRISQSRETESDSMGGE